MIHFSVAELAGLLRVRHINGDAVFDVVSTDSRTISGSAFTSVVRPQVIIRMRSSQTKRLDSDRR